MTKRERPCVDGGGVLGACSLGESADLRVLACEPRPLHIEVGESMAQRRGAEALAVQPGDERAQASEGGRIAERLREVRPGPGILLEQEPGFAAEAEEPRRPHRAFGNA